MATARIGVQEFHENLLDYLEADLPLAITRHDETIGFYVPVLREPENDAMAALERAGEVLRGLMATSGANEF